MTTTPGPVTEAAITAAVEAIHRADCEHDLADCIEYGAHRRAAADAIEAAAPHMAYRAGRAAGDRLAELEKLAADILDSYHKTGDGYRGRVGQVQIQRWRHNLDNRQ